MYSYTYEQSSRFPRQRIANEEKTLYTIATYLYIYYVESFFLIRDSRYV